MLRMKVLYAIGKPGINHISMNIITLFRTDSGHFLTNQWRNGHYLIHIILFHFQERQSQFLRRS